MYAVDPGLGASKAAMTYLSHDNNLWKGSGITQQRLNDDYGDKSPTDFDKILRDVFETFNANQLAMQKQNNASALNLWREQKNWQTEMANTAHQREAADLRAAGFNPILTAVGGTPTSGAPTGGSTSNPQKSDAEGNFIADIAMALAVGVGKILNSASDVLKDGIKFNTKLSLF